MTFKIAICAGHGYNTPGKRTPDGEREWTFNDKVARAFISEINKYAGVEVRRFDDPSGKTDVPLATRTNRANSWGADIYISFHHNANTGKWGDWTGTETYYWRTSTEGKKLAEVVQKALVKAYGLRDRGLKTSNLHITRETEMPSVLTEGGFMDSRIDIKKLRDDSVLSDAGKFVAQAVADYAGLAKKEGKHEDKKVKQEKVKSSGRTSQYTGNSVVDYLKSINQDASFNNRARLAKQYGISNYRGTAKQNSELLRKLRSGEKPKAKKGGSSSSTYSGNSVVDYLKSIKADHSFANRSRLAKKHGIKNYRGTASQNTELLRKLRGF